jgi:hypothetical protein
LETELMDLWRDARIWIASAFSASLGLALCIIAVFGIKRGVVLALPATARLAFVFFWPAYTGAALTSLFGEVFSPLRARARELGLAFAAALLVHLALVACLCVIGPAPGLGTFVIFGVAAGCTYLLALLSIQRVRQALPQKLWPPIRFVAMNYIALAFLFDFARLPSHSFLSEVRYLPFAALAIIGPILKLAAWAAQTARAPHFSRLPHPRAVAFGPAPPVRRRSENKG